jgi:2-polyprenyl-3-methyl-5-hydroxy-6-metoxy-1,4-benzoquinol methylase
MSRTNSSIAEVSLPQKLSEAIVLLRQRPAEQDRAEGIESILDSIDDYRWTYERITGRDFAKARVFEIGFGARPLRLIALISMGVDVRGIDLDMPMLQFSIRRLGHILRQNGLERALKTGVRALLFDRRERRDLETALNRRGYTQRIDPERFLVGDAAECSGEYGSVDMVYSNNVFEHILPASLERVIQRFATVLSPHGIAIITPDIFTGICGGHLLEWYRAASDQSARVKSEAWEHLRR